jgi:ABC-type multidrug transport system fused ATPase/permease subunit
LEEQGKPIYMDVPCGVRLSHVRYAYDDVKEVKGDEAEHEVSMRRAGLAPVIDDLSFDFRPGSCTAILGETGAGKTTLVRLILALLSPQEGQVEIYDDRHVRQVSPRLRCNFVYVPQGNTLLSGTIRDNLRLGRLDATDEEILEALHDACADFVNELPQGLDTICSEKGGGLSEGQAQRIAIARALLRDRPIMLFDEATSALDPETERQLLQNILGHNDKTVVFITHRPAVVEYCDQVLEVGKGV